MNVRPHLRRVSGLAGGALLALVLLAALAVSPLLRTGAPAGPGLTSAPARAASVAPVGRERRGETASHPDRRQSLRTARAGLAAAAPLPGSAAADLPPVVTAVPAGTALVALPGPATRHVTALATGLPQRRGPPVAEAVLAVLVHPRPA